MPAIASTPELDLVALCDPIPGRAADYAARFGGEPFVDPERFFDSGLDVVVVTSSAPAHGPNVLAAAHRSLPILCEKPIAMDDREAEQMMEAMGETPFFVAFCYRFSPVAQQIKRWVGDRLVGEIRALRLIYNWHLHGQFMQAPDGSWIESPYYRGRMDEGGPLVDCGVHQIDLARWWLSSKATDDRKAGCQEGTVHPHSSKPSPSDIVDWSAAGAWVANYEAPDHVWLHLQHSGGALITIEVSYAHGHTAKEPRPVFTYELIGTGGVIRYDREGYVLEARHGQGTVKVPGASEKNFAGMYGALVRQLQGEPVDMPTAEDGIVATRIARNATNWLIEHHWSDGRR